jgi:hypothetical protein
MNQFAKRRIALPTVGYGSALLWGLVELLALALARTRGSTEPRRLRGKR